MSSSVFQRIIHNELPAFRVWENEWTLTILPLASIQLGHCLVIPKIPVDAFDQVPEPYYSEMFMVSRRISFAIRKVTQCRRVGMIIAGFEVPHCHLHLVPINSESELSFQNVRELSESQKKSLCQDLNRAAQLYQDQTKPA